MPMHTQRGVRGTVRPTISAHVDARIRHRIELLADQYESSYSFVEHTLLAKALGVNLEETIYDLSKREVADYSTGRSTRRKTAGRVIHVSKFVGSRKSKRA